MQSQQKRVKWSRGETAEALEERTDTGITQASVELMENCIPDIYGNVSRRPAFKLLENGDWGQVLGFDYDEYAQFIPFYLTENEYILCCILFNDRPEFMRIKDNVIVWADYLPYSPGTAQPAAAYPTTGASVDGVRTYRPVSYAQQGNYLLIADGYNVYRLTFELSTWLSPYEFKAYSEAWQFSAGWYAKNGTTTGEVSQSTIPNLRFNGSFTNYIYNDSAGMSTVYSMIDTGLTGATEKAQIEQQIPVGSIVKFPNKGCYFRVEGYFMQSNSLYFSDTTFDSVTTTWWDQAPTISGVTCSARHGRLNYGGGQLVHYNSSGTQISNISVPQSPIYVKCNASSTGYMQTSWYWGGADAIFTNWTEVPAATVEGTNVKMFGSLLTAVADPSAEDTAVGIETGYDSLQPDVFGTHVFPHPRKLVFHNQRLWAGGWLYATDTGSTLTKTEEYAITLGSQIGRYNDLKNDYNLENEPITLDILTQYREKIVHLVDYNGLKIMTDSYEYAYENGGTVKQSANGSFEYCDPIVFDSLCLYIDSTGCQVKAMQYEFQSNIFNSSTINQLTPHDLVWYPWGMAQYEDKVNSTGKYLFLVNREDANTRIAVCNFVPGNQANIWSRWSLSSNVLINGTPKPIIHSVVNLKNGVLFMVSLNRASRLGNEMNQNYILPAMLDFSDKSDFEASVYVRDNVAYCGPWIKTSANGQILSFSGATVNVYSDGVFQWTDTLTTTGALTKDISQLTNVTAGLPINSIIRSHPIDVGGKTKSIKKRIGKAQMSVHDTDTGAITINGKTGYMNPVKDHISFYGVTGMKNEIKYTLTNKNGAMFHLESLLMNIEYGTLDS